MTTGATVARPSGRAANQLRRVKLRPAALRYAEGSCMIELGKTVVLCSASVDDKVPTFLRGEGRGWITAEYGMLPRSTQVRTPRDIWRGKAGGRTHEIQRLIGRSLRAVADLAALGDRSILIDCDVIEADGGTRVAAITGSFVALAGALERLRKEKLLKGRVLRDYVAAISVGLVGGVPILDLEYTEDVAAGVDMNVVMTGSQELVEVQGTADSKPFSTAELGKLVQLAAGGIRRLIAAQRRAIQLDRLP
jgi:ribonuclease PH